MLRSTHAGLMARDTRNGRFQLVWSNTTAGIVVPTPGIQRASAGLPDEAIVLPSVNTDTVTGAVGARVRRSVYVSGTPGDTRVAPSDSTTSTPPVSLSRISTSCSRIALGPSYRPPVVEISWKRVRNIRFSGIVSSTAVTRTTNASSQFVSSKVIVRAVASKREACTGRSAETASCVKSPTRVTTTVSPGFGERVSFTV